jgi:hypothetical protein
MLVLHAAGVSRLAERSRSASALLITLRGAGLWPPVVPSAVLVESLTGHVGRDVSPNRLLKGCDVVTELPEPLARRAAALRYQARSGSAVDAIVVATAEPGGTVLTGAVKDLQALADQARDVVIARV